MTRDPEVSFERITAEFVARFFGAQPSERWQRFFEHLYAAALPLKELTWRAWHDAASAMEALTYPGPTDGTWSAGLRLAHDLRKDVSRNRTSFDNLVMVLRLREHWDWRSNRLREVMEGRPDNTRLKGGLSAIAGRDAQTAERFLGMWHRFYAPAHPRDSLRWGLGMDQNLYASLCAAADYTSALARGSGLQALLAARENAAR
jgi:hypothetical protein